MKLFCISGFLGLAQDWDILKKSKLEISAHAAQEFLEGGIAQINSLGLKEKADVICGYSLGGRLALQAFLEPANHWRAAIFISAHPGLQNRQEKLERIENDKIWAQKFLKTPWKELLDAWNAQPVFGENALQREEKDFKRNELSELMDKFSLGRQRDLRPQLSQVEKPVLFITGAKDQKFSNLAEEMTSLNERFKHILVPDVAHRVLWEVSDLESLVRRFKNI